MKATAAALILASAVAWAGDDTEIGGMLALLEEQRVTSASRFEQDVSDAPSSVTVITRRQIAISGAHTLSDLLRLVPGMDVVAINPLYVAASIRGFNDESNTTLLLLLDGVKMNLEFTGGPFVQILPVPIEDIERIEVIRGPGSAVWGQNAYLGVINIITRDPRELPAPVLEVDARAGNLGALHSTLRYAAPGERISFKAFVAYDTVNDWDDGERNGRTLEDGGVTLIHGRAGETGEIRFDALLERAQGTVFSTLGEIGADARQSLVRLTGHAGDATLSAYWTRLDIDFELRFPGLVPDVFPALGAFSGVADTYDAELLYDRTFGINHLTTGAHARINEFSSDVLTGGGDEERLWGVFVQDVLELPRAIAITAGVRYDGNSINEAAVSPRLSLVWEPRDHHTFRASAGRAFRNPSFIENQIDIAELRAIFPTGSISNPDLKNEEVTSYELAYRLHLSNLRVNANAFYDRIRDFAKFDTEDPSSPTYARYVNLRDGFRSYGAELEIELAPSDSLELFGHVAALHISENPRDSLVDDEAPKLRALAGVRFRERPIEGSLAIHYMASRTYDIQDPNVGLLGPSGSGFVPVDIDPYVSVNLYAGVKIWRDRLTLYVAGSNVLDADVEEFPARPWDDDHDPGTPSVRFGGGRIPRQISCGLKLAW